jgi:hypothetical protein
LKGKRKKEKMERWIGGINSTDSSLALRMTSLREWIGGGMGIRVTSTDSSLRSE